MSLVPEEELKKALSLNLAPMVDFLFVVVAVFSTLALTRALLYDTQVELVKVRAERPVPTDSLKGNEATINIGITADGRYKWITEVTEFLLETPQTLQKELQKQQQLGLISPHPEQTKILLHIDQKARWESIVQALLALREQGFPVHPVYNSQSAAYSLPPRGSSSRLPSP